MMATNVSNAKPEAVRNRIRPWDHAWFWVGAIVLASVAVRLAAIFHWGTGAIETEGVGYARIAQNLRNGTGYVGMTSPGLQLVFPPFYPLLIAFASFFTHDYEWAGRLVSLIFEVLLPLPIFAIASRLYGRRVGFLAAALAVFYPLLVNLSFAVLSEAVYIPLLMLGVYLVLGALDASSIWLYCLIGAIFGFAYLTRQEAVASLFIAVLLTLFLGKGSVGARCKRAGAALAIFAIVALPEVVFLYRATGQIRLETKSSIFYAAQVRAAIARQNGEAMPEEWAEHAINSNLERTGTQNRPEADVVRETRINSRQLIHNLGRGVRENIPVLLDQFNARWLAAPFLLALACLGAFRMPWKRDSIAGQLYVFLVPLAAIVATFSFSGWTSVRYYFVLVPFLLIWAASGLAGVGSWAKASAEAAGWSRFWPKLAQGAAIALTAAVIVLYPVSGVRSIWDFQHGSPSTLYQKQLGLWIGQQQDRRVTIMDRSTPVAFHANAAWVDFPYCDGNLALRFLDAAKVDYVVLRQGEQYTKYYEDWVAGGIPDPRAERVYEVTAPDGNKTTVYRWHREDSH
jgi:4-amino-4-deoxy-L-arabinose transferase-like glycosyltransferase